MKKQNKWIFIIFAIIIICSFIAPNLLKANTFGDSVNESLISALSIKETVTGLEPFDINNDAGNDSSADNDIVRSFDNVNYTLEYVTALKQNTPISDAYLMLEFILPCTKDVATFDMSTMTWIEDPILIEENGQQILRGRRHLANTSLSTVIPGAGTLSTGIHIRGAANGTKITPEFKLWMEGNSAEEAKTIASKELTVSAAPKYNVVVERNWNLDYLSYFDFENNTVSQVKTENAEHGRLQGFSIALQLYNDNSSKGMKGIEIPQGNIEFDLSFEEAISLNSSSEVITDERFYPLLWDYNENTAPTKGKLGRDFWFKNNSNFSANIAPYNKGTDGDSCYDGGNWQITQTDSNSFHVVISDYNFSPDFIFPTRSSGDEPNTLRHQSNVGFFSTGYVEVLCAFPDTVEDTVSIYLTAEASNLKATSISNQEAHDVLLRDNKNVSTITLYPEGAINRTIEFREQWIGDYSQPPWTSRGDTSYFQGELFTVCANGNHKHDYDIHGFDMLLKFDPTAFEFPRKEDIYFYTGNCWGGGDPGVMTYLYAAKPDKSTAWTNFEEMRDTRQEELIYFSDLDELKAQGYTCVGFLAEGRNSTLDGGLSVFANLKVKDDAEYCKTYAFINDFRIWFESPDFSFEDIEYDHSTNSYPKNDVSDLYAAGYPEPDMFSYTTATNNYIKTEYDEDGKIVVGTHAGGYTHGNTVLVIDYEAQIQQEIIDRDPFGEVKTVYDMDANERTINFKLTPKAVSIMTNASSDTNLYIYETLPKDLTYIPNSTYWGDQPLEPIITENEDGTTTLKWTLSDVEINATLDELTFACSIGHPGTNQDVKNNQIITPTVRISGDGDIREALLINNNYAETSFSVIKLTAISISKTTNTPTVSTGQDFDFVLKYANNAETAVVDSKIYDILPYNNDGRNSAFDGSYKINSITINFINAPKTFNDFINSNYVVGYIVEENIPANNFNYISSINNWINITDKTINENNKTVTYSNISENATALIFNMKLEGLEYIEITLNISPTGNQREGNTYTNNFYQYSPEQTEKVVSNYATVIVEGCMQITKIWNDENNKYNTRPESLSIKLYQNGEEFRTITLTSNNVDKDDNNKWVYSLNDVPLTDAQGNPYNYTIQEESLSLTTSFYKTPVYSQDSLTVINTGIWVYNNQNPEYVIIVNKDIINKNNQPATKEDFDKINLNTENDIKFQIVLKQLNRTITNNGTNLSESYNGYSGNEYHGLVTDTNQLIFRNVPAGKYEISENIIQYFEFIGIEKIENSEHASFTVENGKYYVTLSGLYENNEHIEVKITNKIDDENFYKHNQSKENLFLINKKEESDN